MSIKSAAQSLQPFGNLIAVFFAAVGGASFVSYKLGQKSRDYELINEKLTNQAKLIDMMTKMEIEAIKKEAAQNINKYFYAQEQARKKGSEK